jgi:HAE1 family hydrophobic/amphiphilic exporter-1
VAFYESWIDKPRRALLLLVFLCVLAGLFAFTIPLGYLPRPVRKTVLITVERRNGFEEETERAIVEPLEKELAALPGITEMFSTAERGRARILLTFSAQTDLDAAFLDVREIVHSTYTGFAQDVQRPVVLKSDPFGQPVFIAGFPADGDLGEKELKRVFENVEGSGEVTVAGSPRREIVITYDPQKLSASNLCPDDLIRSVRKANIVGGFGREGEQPHLIDNRLRSLDQLLDLQISDGMRLRDVARARMENRRAEIMGSVNGRPRIILLVQPEGQANLLSLCTRLERVSADLPSAEILYSYGTLVRGALAEILRCVSIGILCVVLLTFLFMRRLLPAVLVSANIPVSIIASLALLRAAGEELNIMTLSGIAVGVGLVIDAGVVYVEEYFRSGGNSIRAVSLSRAPILFSAATTAAVFLPLLFAPSLLVDRFRGFALSIVGSLASSCFFVFVFLPVFLYHLCGSQPAERRLRAGVRAQKRIPAHCLRDLMRAVNNFRRPLAAFGIVLGGVLSFVLVRSERQEFDTAGLNAGFMNASVEYPSGYPAELVLQSALPIEKKLTALSGVERVSGRYEKERASFFIQLERSARKERITAFLREEEQGMAEGFIHFPEGASASFPVSLSGPQPEQLKLLAGRLAGEIQRLPECRGILLHFKDALPSKVLRVDVHKTVQAGENPRRLCSQMSWALSTPVVDKWTTGGREMDVVLQAGTLDQQGRSLSSLLALPCQVSALPLGSMVYTGEKPQAGRIYHLNRSRSASFEVLTEWRDRAGALRSTRRILSTYPFPPEYRGQIGGEVEEQRLLSRATCASLALSVALIFFILMFQFESLSICLVVMLQIPGAFIGPVLLLEALSWPLTLPFAVGLILTGGIAVNNAILVFEDLRGLRPTLTRVYKALARKLRPIAVSSLTTIGGIAPLLITGGANRGILAPLSLTVAAGIAGSFVVLILSLSAVAAKE